MAPSFHERHVHHGQFCPLKLERGASAEKDPAHENDPLQCRLMTGNAAQATLTCTYVPGKGHEGTSTLVVAKSGRVRVLKLNYLNRKEQNIPEYRPTDCNKIKIRRCGLHLLWWQPRPFQRRRKRFDHTLSSSWLMVSPRNRIQHNHAPDLAWWSRRGGLDFSQIHCGLLHQILGGTMWVTTTRTRADQRMISKRLTSTRWCRKASNSTAIVSENFRFD